MKNKYLMTIIVAILIGVLAFFAGMKYQLSQATRGTNPGRQFSTGNNTNGRPTGQGRFGGAGRPVAGDIISLDDKSITVKLQDGSSKIVLLTSSTSISKSTEASRSDLMSGIRVLATGVENSDGSITAGNIQLNPAFGGGLNNRMPSQTP